MAHPHALVNAQERGGNSLARNADHRFTASSLQTDLSSAVVELRDSRASVCAGVVEQGAVSVERETDLIAGIGREHHWRRTGALRPSPSRPAALFLSARSAPAFATSQSGTENGFRRRHSRRF